MNTFIYKDVKCLIYKPKIINYFTNFKVVFFLNSLLYSISLVINVYNIYFLDKDVITNSYFFILRFLI